MAEDSKAPRTMPKRKGGTRFPRYSLSDAVPWAKKLVSKTHSGPQPKDVVASGVVSSKGSTAEIRISALKQFGLLDGSATAYIATDLARNIVNAPEAELVPLLAKAALTPPVFYDLYNTFQADAVSKAKLKQRAAGLDVHPDEAERCVEIYIASMAIGKLVAIEGETITHATLQRETVGENGVSEAEEHSDDEEENREATEEKEVGDDSEGSGAKTTRRGAASVNITIAVDSSLDTDKLEKQLKLLKKFGAL